MLYTLDEIKTALNRNLKLEILNVIDSTSSELRRRLSVSPVTAPDVLLAYGQTAGRGRQGKSFFSPSDAGIYMTLHFRAQNPAALVHLTAKAAVCVCKAIRSVTRIDAKIKWVNDIYFRDKKICGILCENIYAMSNGCSDILVGIGINMKAVPFPKDLHNAAFIPKAEGLSAKLVAEILNRIYPSFEDLSDTTFLDDYRKLSCVLGREIFYTMNGATKSAIATSIDQNGFLYVKHSDGSVQCLNSGEISLKF